MKRELEKLLLGQTLSEAEMFAVVEVMVGGGPEEVSDAQIGALLFAMATRIPSAEELIGAAQALRKHMLRIDTKHDLLLDTAGTGGSGHNTFNTSTVTALVLAAAGVAVAKHGNRAATSACGSADVLEALGVKIDLEPARSLRCLERTNFCFLFAPLHHGATKRVQVIRKQLGFRTLFNYLGPLANPAGATVQLVGVSEPLVCSVYAQALSALGVRRAMVVSGAEKLDEITLTGETQVHEISAKEIRSYSFTPEQFGKKRADLTDIAGAKPQEAAKEVKELLLGKRGPKRDLVEINAGAALYLCGRAETPESGAKLAASIVDSGAPQRTLAAIISETNSPE